MKLVFTRPFRSSVRRGGSAFSLVELLVVIAIISIMGLLGTAAFRNIGQAQGVSGAAALAAGLALEARAEAMSHQWGARLIVDSHFDPEAPDPYLRRFLVVRAQREDPASPITWHQLSRPVFLPNNVYLLENYSDGLGSMSWDFSGAAEQDGTQGQAAYFIEYDGFGMLIPSNGPGDTRMVFASGVPNVSAPPHFPENFLNGRAGFVLRRAGRVSFFETPDHMPEISP